MKLLFGSSAIGLSVAVLNPVFNGLSLLAVAFVALAGIRAYVLNK